MHKQQEHQGQQRTSELTGSRPVSRERVAEVIKGLKERSLRAAQKAVESSSYSTGYKKLSRQVGLQKQVMEFQENLLLVRCDDDVFKSLFGMYVHHSGPVFGAAFVCDDDAQLQLIGRFGVPGPDPAPFCLALMSPIVDTVLSNLRVILIDATEQVDRFDVKVRRYLPGMTLLAIPLVPAEGQMIGLVILYRKGEQPFMDSDVTLAEMISKSTALAVQRND